MCFWVKVIFGYKGVYKMCKDEKSFIALLAFINASILPIALFYIFKKEAKKSIKKIAGLGFFKKFWKTKIAIFFLFQLIFLFQFFLELHKSAPKRVSKGLRNSDIGSTAGFQMVQILREIFGFWLPGGSGHVFAEILTFL